MPAKADDFHELMDHVLMGSEEAAQELVELYGPAVLRAVRRRLNSRLRSKFDSDDFVQDVWASFFADPPRMNTFRSPDDLAGFLAVLARNKVVDVVRKRLQLDKSNVNREESLEDAPFLVQDQLIAQQPSPSTAAMTREEWDELLRKQPLVYRRILLRFRDGRTPAEIAQEQEISERTVRRVIARTVPGMLT
jgi:RNA polymerase sigma-70 factor (ECF subfamily)